MRYLVVGSWRDEMDREKPIKLAHQAAVEHQLQIQQRARILKGIELGERAIRREELYLMKLLDVECFQNEYNYPAVRVL
jgi:hypothetical protein